MASLAVMGMLFALPSVIEKDVAAALRWMLPVGLLLILAGYAVARRMTLGSGQRWRGWLLFGTGAILTLQVPVQIIGGKEILQPSFVADSLAVGVFVLLFVLRGVFKDTYCFHPKCPEFRFNISLQIEDDSLNDGKEAPGAFLSGSGGFRHTIAAFGGLNDLHEFFEAMPDGEDFIMEISSKQHELSISYQVAILSNEPAYHERLFASTLGQSPDDGTLKFHNLLLGGYLAYIATGKEPGSAGFLSATSINSVSGFWHLQKVSRTDLALGFALLRSPRLAEHVRTIVMIHADDASHLRGLIESALKSLRSQGHWNSCFGDLERALGGLS